MKYSVLLLYPPEHSIEPVETLFSHEEADNPTEAIAQARIEAAVDCGITGEANLNGFMPLLVLEGHHKWVDMKLYFATWAESMTHWAAAS
jgi:hypothetical protein